MQRVRLLPVLLPLVIISAACSYDSTSYSPTQPGPSGVYAATQFTVAVEDTTLDELAAGVSIDITLTPDGRTSGSLHVPTVASATSLNGTYSQEGDVIIFDHTPATVLTLFPFHLVGDELQGEGRAGPGTVHITLRRSQG